MNAPARARRVDLGLVFRRDVAVRRRRGEVVEDARRADDRGLLRMRERNLDDLDAEERASSGPVRRAFEQPGSSVGERTPAEPET